MLPPPPPSWCVVVYHSEQLSLLGGGGYLVLLDRMLLESTASSARSNFLGLDARYVAGLLLFYGALHAIRVCGASPLFPFDELHRRGA